MSIETLSSIVGGASFDEDIICVFPLEDGTISCPGLVPLSPSGPCFPGIVTY